MKSNIIDSIKLNVRQAAQCYLIVGQTKLQELAVDEDTAIPMVSDFLEHNLASLDMEIEDMEEVVKIAFPYFYDKGIEAAINQHFGRKRELKYNQEDLINLTDPDFPSSVLQYINNLALVDIANKCYDAISKHKKDFDKEGYNVFDICEQILLSAFTLGVELATQIPLKSNDFNIKKAINSGVKVDALTQIHDMAEIHCPFCHQPIYRAPRELEYQHLARIANCPHISLQFFQGQDEAFLMGEAVRNMLSEAASDFLNKKGAAYLKTLNDFFKNPEYTIDHFLMDIYITKRISEEDELSFLNMLSEIIPFYEIKASSCQVNGNVVVNYFMKEKAN